MYMFSLPKSALASGTYLHFSGLVNDTHCVLSASRQYTSHSHRMLQKGEGLTFQPTHFTVRTLKYWRLCKTCLVSDFGNTNVMFVGAALLFHSPGSALLSWCAPSQPPFPLPGSLECLCRPCPLVFTPSTFRSPCLAPPWGQPSRRKNWTPADRVEGKREKEEEKKTCRKWNLSCEHKVNEIDDLDYTDSEGDSQQELQRCSDRGSHFRKTLWIWISMFQCAYGEKEQLFSL